jgi:Family of unknown function (DUF6703)
VRVSSPLRRAVERRTVGGLTWLATRPRWVPFVLVLALLLGGLFTPPAVGAALLAVLLLALLWLTYLAWPRLESTGRFTRLLVLVLVLYVLVQRLV